jgi:hypothetical protein
MAHDKTPERGNLIIFYTGLSVVVLIALAFAFKSYFSIQVGKERSEKILTQPAEQLRKVEAEHRKELRNAPLPIDRAVRHVAKRDRSQLQVIEPEESGDTAPLEGWSFARSEPTMQRWLPEPGAGADAGTAAADGGTSSQKAGDAGVQSEGSEQTGAAPGQPSGQGGAAAEGQGSETASAAGAQGEDQALIAGAGDPNASDAETSRE